MPDWKMGQEAFQAVMPHHAGMKSLWETKWKAPCMESTYPFHDGCFDDFEPIFEYLIKNNINDMRDSLYTEAFFHTAEALESAGDEVIEVDPKHACDLYLRACAVLRIARFPHITCTPYINSEIKWHAHKMQKKIYLKASKTWKIPVEDIVLPHINAKQGDRMTFPVYARVPEGAIAHPVPTVVLLTGLDGYRPDNTARCNEILARGWASVVVEIPGTADCAANPADPKSPDRLWSSLFTWMYADGRYDMKRIVAWGLSCGGYYAVRMAHTHRDRLAGAVAQGAGIHHVFDKDWIAKAEGHEYPASFATAMAWKYGFITVKDYTEDAQAKFSLLKSGILDMPSTRLLLVNGVQDGLMPIEDSLLLFEHGSPKEGRFFQNALHMGYPKANPSIYSWIENIMASVPTHTANNKTAPGTVTTRVPTVHVTSNITYCPYGRWK